MGLSSEGVQGFEGLSGIAGVLTTQIVVHLDTSLLRC